MIFFFCFKIAWFFTDFFPTYFLQTFYVDFEDSSDYELNTSSTDNSNSTLTEEMSSEEDGTLIAEKEEDEDEIEIMRDLPGKK